jgi:hypothetical protein
MKPRLPSAPLTLDDAMIFRLWVLRTWPGGYWVWHEHQQGSDSRDADMMLRAQQFRRAGYRGPMQAEHVHPTSPGWMSVALHLGGAL